MIDEVRALTDEQRQQLLLNAVHREIILSFPGDNSPSEIGSDNIISESFELVQSICDESELKFGGGIAGQMRVELFGINATALPGKKVLVKIRERYAFGTLMPSNDLKPSDTLVPGLRESTIEALLFTGTVYEVKRKKDNRSIFELTAYDKLYACSKIRFTDGMLADIQIYSDPSEIVNLDAWMGKLIDVIVEQDYIDTFTIGTDQTARFNLPTTMSYVTTELIHKVANNGFSLTEIMSAYSELNAGFLCCNRFGKLRSISLCRMVPNTTENETEKITVSEDIQAYANLEFEEFIVEPIHYISFPYNDNQHYAYGFDKNHSCYISDNIITRMMTNNSDFVFGFYRRPHGGNFIFNDLCTYRPFKADVFARWWLEPGDRVTIQTGFDDMPTVDSFVFNRTIKGINGMMVTLEAKGIQYLGHKEEEDGTIQ